MTQPTYEELVAYGEYAESRLLEAGLPQDALRFWHGQILSSCAELSNRKLADWWENFLSHATGSVEEKELIPMMLTLHALQRADPLLYKLFNFAMQEEMKEKATDKSNVPDLNKLLFDA